jgi:hypothetical protein
MEVLCNQQGSKGVDLERVTQRLGLNLGQLLFGAEAGSMKDACNVEDQLQLTCLARYRFRRGSDGRLVPNVERDRPKTFGMLSGELLKLGGFVRSPACRDDATVGLPLEQLSNELQADTPACSLDQ